MNNEDLKRVETFIEITDKFRNLKFLQETKSINFELTTEANGLIAQRTKGFDEELLRSFLMDFRKILLAQDMVKFEDICEIVFKNTNNLGIKNNVGKCKELFLKIRNSSPMKLNLDGKDLTIDDILDVWLYGHYIHEKPNSKRVEEFKKLGIAIKMHKFIFISTIISMAKVAICLAENSKEVIKRLEQNGE